MLATRRGLVPSAVLGRKMHIPGWVVVQAILSSRNAILVFVWIKGRDNHRRIQEGTKVLFYPVLVANGSVLILRSKA